MRSGVVPLLLILGFSGIAVLDLHEVASAAGILVQVPTRAADLANDFIDWGVLGPDGTTVSNPFTQASNGGNDVTGSMPAPPNGNFQRRDEGNGWIGIFAPGDHLLWTGSGSPDPIWPGPMTLQFATPLSGVGAQIQDDFFGAYTATLNVYSPKNTLLGTFTVAGDNTFLEDNTAPFLGVIDTQQEIGKIVYNVTDVSGNTADDFAINRLDMRTSLAPIPEPSTLVLLGAGLPAFVVPMMRRKAPRK